MTFVLYSEHDMVKGNRLMIVAQLCYMATPIDLVKVHQSIVIT